MVAEHACIIVSLILMGRILLGLSFFLRAEILKLVRSCGQAWGVLVKALKSLVRAVLPMES